MTFKDEKSFEEFLNKDFSEETEIMDNNTKEKSNKKSKKLVVKIVSLALAGVMAVTSLVAGIVNLTSKKKNKPSGKTFDTTSISETTLGDMGISSEITSSEKKEYGATTGNVDKSKIVTKNGKVYATQSDADKSSKVGTSSIDLQGGKYKIDNNGKVVENDTHYEIKDETGKKVSEGTLSNNEVPAGYSFDSTLGKYVKTEDVGKYKYDENGDLVPVNSNKKADTTSTTTTSTQSTTTNPSTTSSTSSVDKVGTVNPNGTYTAYGVTYKSKADFEQFLLHPEEYGVYNGIVQPVSDIEKSAQKVK